MEQFEFPKDFLMGTSVSSVMVEGGNRNTNWFKWSEDGKINDGSHVIRGTDHWNRYQDDIGIMKELNNDTYCMSVEWSRIEPKEGQYDLEAVSHYREELSTLIKNGIRPMITLHHFSNPQWFDDIGGWANPDSVDIFTRFTSFTVSQLGDIVNDWITFNDPNITLIAAYLWAWFPPGLKEPKLLIKAMKNVIHAHIKCYTEIHSIRKKNNFPGETIVGVSIHFRILDPVNNNPLNRWAAWFAKYFSQDMLLKGMTEGKFSYPLGFGNYPVGKGKYYDFIGINYWTRNIVNFKLDVKNLFCELKVKDNVDKTDGGWEIYPEGLYRTCKEYYQKYKAPIFIVQNGLREPVEDKRPRVIYENLKYVAKLIKEGIPVKRYYIWTLIDIFECHEGESAKLGIVENDFSTQKRTIRKSGKMYGDICKNKAVTKEITDNYLKNAE